MKKLLSSAIRAFISIFFIILLLYIMRDKYPQILKAFASTSIPIFLLSLLAFVFGTLDKALENYAQEEKQSYREALRDFRNEALLSRELATIRTDVSRKSH